VAVDDSLPIAQPELGSLKAELQRLEFTLEACLWSESDHFACHGIFSMRAACLALTVFALLLAGAAPANKVRVSFDLITEKGFPNTGHQQWHKALSDLGVTNLRIHSGSDQEKPAIENDGSARAPSYKVTGILKANGTLQLPGGTFAMRDAAGLRKWIAELSDQGPAGVTQSKGAFGLLPEQLAAVHKDLTRSVRESTKGVNAAKAVEAIGRSLDAPLVLDRAAPAALAEVTLEEDLAGLSSGTALAAILRPAGLVLQPERPSGGKLQYRIGAARPGDETWPIGWKTEEAPRTILPTLFEQINVEITDAELPEVLRSIEERLEVPFLFDHNALATYNIDLAKISASVPNKRLSYSQILQKALLKAKLKYELRKDEAGKPLIWITSIKPI
jgi:hypothetical protein